MDDSSRKNHFQGDVVMLSKQAMTALVLVLAVTSYSVAQQGPSDKAPAPSISMDSKRPSVKGQEGGRPGFQVQGVPTHATPADCTGVAADAIVDAGLFLGDKDLNWPTAQGFNDTFFVQVVCTFNGAYVIVATNDDWGRVAIVDRITKYISNHAGP
jgi:hypothetical protein